MNNKRRRVTEAQALQICELHAQGLTSREVGAMMGFGHATILRVWHRGGVRVDSSPAHRTHVLDERFFQTIDTEEKAYWLGFVSADGNVSASCLTVNLAVVDAGHLETFKAALQSSAPIRVINEGKAVNFSVYSRDLVQDLGRLGVHPVKSRTIRPWEGDADLQRHYWRGVFDGDGSIFQDGGKTWCLHLAGSQWIIERFAESVRTLSKAKGRPICGSTGTWNCRVSGRNVARDIARWLYDDAAIALPRKLKLAQELLSSYYAARPPARNKIEIAGADVREAYESGLSTVQLALQYGVSDPVIARIVREAGGKMRTANQGRQARRQQEKTP